MSERFPGNITDVQGLRVGQAQDVEARTGLTCILLDRQGVGGVDVRGAAPGTRETDLLRPGMMVQGPDAILLTGGSAYGLSAAGGLMRFLEEQGRGVPVGNQVVPIVCAAVIMDLLNGRGDVRPDEAMAYAAAGNAGKAVSQGAVGAGTGATVGKLVPGSTPARGGVGTASLPLPGGGHVGAIVVVNAAGDVYHPHTGGILACGRDGQGHPQPFAALLAGQGTPSSPTGNTTIGVVATDVALDKAGANRLACMGQDGLARAIQPVHTQVDGDTVFGLSTSYVESQVPPLLIEALAAEVMARAIANAFLGESL